MKKKATKSNRSRRDFIKTNMFGSLFLASGLPLLSFKQSESPERVNPLQTFGEDYADIDWTKIREQFPIIHQRKYFNAGSLGPSPQLVTDKVIELLTAFEKRGVSGHSKISKERIKAANFFNAHVDEIAFTRNTTEGMNIAARSLPLKKGDEILITDQEHIGGAAPWLALQKDVGVTVRLVKLDLSGEKNLQRIKESISPKTKLISFSHITSMTGMLLPAKELVNLCRENNIFSCIDGAQSAGMIPVDLQDINPDFYACSGHKWLYGPLGTGILFINKSVIEQCSPNHVGAYTDKKYDLSSLTLEYHMKASREEYGTRDSPNVYGLGTAIDFIESIGIANIKQRGLELADYFKEAIVKRVKNIEFLSPSNQLYRTPLITFRIKGVDSLETTKSLLTDKEVRMRGIHENKLNAFRVSFSVFNTKEEIDFLIDCLQSIESKN